MAPHIFLLLGLAGYVALIVGAFVKNLRLSKIGSRTIADEAIGVRRFGGGLIALLIAEAMLGPSDALTLSQNGYKYGIIWVILPLGAALAQAVAGLFFVRKIFDQFSGRLSLGDIFAERCGPSSRVMVGLVVVAQAIAFAGVLILAGGQLLESLLGLERVYGMLMTAGLIGLMTSLGGISVVIDTNKIQAFFAWLIVILAGIAASHLIGNANPAEVNSLLVRPAFEEEYTIKIGLGIFVAYFFGELLLPTYATRALVAKDSSSARNGFLLAALLLVVWYLVMIAAGSSSALMPASSRASTDEAVLLDIVRVPFAPHSLAWNVVGGICISGLLALIYSSLNAFLNTGAVAFARDVAGAVIKDELRQGQIERWTVLLIAIGGLLVGLSGDSLLSVLLIGYTIWVPTLLVPFGWIILHPNQPLDQRAFWAAVIIGGIFWYIFEYEIASFMPGILAGFLANAATLVATQRMLRPRN